MSAFQRNSYTRQARSGKVSRHVPRPHSDARSFMFLNYAALLQKGAPEAHRAKSKSECTSILMKFLKTLAAARPISLFLVAVIILSAGTAVRIAGPISIHIPRVEIPSIEIHTGSAPVAEPKNNLAPPPRQSQRKHHSHRSRAGVLNKVVGSRIFLES